MTDYRKPQDQLIYDLIEEANPGFKDKFQLGDLHFGAPAAQSVPAGGIANSIATIHPNSNTGKAMGTQKVQYRRIDLSKLFKNMPSIKIAYYQTLNLSMAKFVELFNEKFGLSLKTSDFTRTSDMATNTNYTLEVSSGSLCYAPASIVVNWTRGPRTLEDLLPDQDIGAIQWPGGNDFSEGRKPQGDFMTYGLDCSSQQADIRTHGNGQAIGAESQPFLNWVNARLGTDFNASRSPTLPGGIAGLTRRNATLPYTQAAGANTEKYNSALIIEAAATSWFQGRLIFHYNRT